MAVSDTTLEDIWRKQGIDSAQYSIPPVVTEESTNFRTQMVTSIAVIDEQCIVAKSNVDWGTNPPAITTQFARIDIGIICHLADQFREDN